MTYHIINAIDVDALQRQVNAFIQKNKGCVLHGVPVHDQENGYIQVILTGDVTGQNPATRKPVADGDKIYVGVGKEVKFPDGQTYIHMSMKAEHRALMAAYARENGWTHLDILRRRTPDDYGNTHYAVLTPEYKRPGAPSEHQGPVRAAAITKPVGGIPDTRGAGASLNFCGDGDDIPF